MKWDFMAIDKAAALGSMAEHYDHYLVPLNFAPYADVVAERAKELRPHRVLETRCRPTLQSRPLISARP